MLWLVVIHWLSVSRECVRLVKTVRGLRIQIIIMISSNFNYVDKIFITIFVLFPDGFEQHTFTEARTSKGMTMQNARMLTPIRDHSKPYQALTVVSENC